jgi:hypothetical protein
MVDCVRAFFKRSEVTTNLRWFHVPLFDCVLRHGTCTQPPHCNHPSSCSFYWFRVISFVIHFVTCFELMRRQMIFIRKGISFRTYLELSFGKEI